MKTLKYIIGTYICNQDEYSTDQEAIEAIKQDKAVMWHAIEHLDIEIVLSNIENEIDAYEALNN